MAIATVLLVYSQTQAFAWDEGFHLLAARMIAAGRRPYQDFLFAQTPLNAYWNAFVMWIGGYGWRAPHAAAALETAAGAWLTADYVLRKTRLSIAIAIEVFMGLNAVVLQFATIGQAYGLSMLLGAVAFRCCISGFTAGAGLAAGAAASATLLTAPLGPVLFVWIAIQTGWRRAGAYVLGAAFGLSPVIWWLARDPKQFIFDVAGFHIYYRNVDWSDWAGHDVGILTGWLDSAPGLLVVALALTGAIVGRRRRDVVLCSWIVGVWCIYLATTHPTFAQYFTVIMPFAAILASAALGELYDRYPHRWPLEVIAALVIAVAGRTVWMERSDMSWANLIPVAKAVAELTPQGATLYADEAIYLLAGRMPPPGMEWGSSHKIEMPLDKARPLHVLPQSELDKEVKGRQFPVLETCDDDDVDRLGLTGLYGYKKQIGGCSVFWGLK
jgi:hypothetical protein